jgi:hypothetical protein
MQTSYPLVLILFVVFHPSNAVISHESDSRTYFLNIKPTSAFYVSGHTPLQMYLFTQIFRQQKMPTNFYVCTCVILVMGYITITLIQAVFSR